MFKVKFINLALCSFLAIICLMPNAQTISDTAEIKQINIDSLPEADSSYFNLDAKTKQIIEKYAKILNVDNSAIKYPEIYTTIDQWFGTPYRYGGSSKTGTDCSGFVTQVMKNFTSTPLPRSAAEMSKIITVKKIEELQEGDLVFFNLRNIPNKHVGIYLHNGWFIHASSYKGVGVTLNNLKAENYKRRFSKCGSVNLDKLNKSGIAK